MLSPCWWLSSCWNPVTAATDAPVLTCKPHYKPAVMGNITWIPVSTRQQVDDIAARSETLPCLILKHSTTCSISAMAKYRLEDDWPFGTDELEAYYLDLLSHRDVSAYIAEKFSVHHESPQILLIRNGDCFFDASHFDITIPEIREAL